MKTYLALGDSMSIDDYTGIVGGGAVSQFYQSLGEDWTLIDRTRDGCIIQYVPTTDEANLITLTIGGNDGLALLPDVNEREIARIVNSHRKLVAAIRAKNPDSCFIVGNVYAPDFPLSKTLSDLLRLLNQGIEENVRGIGGRLADIHAAFGGHTSDFLCHQIEPNIKGATAIARLFREQYELWLTGRG